MVRIFPHLDWIGRDTVFSPNMEKHGPEKLLIWTILTPGFDLMKFSFSMKYLGWGSLELFSKNSPKFVMPLIKTFSITNLHCVNLLEKGSIAKSSRSQMFYQIGIFKNFAKFISKAAGLACNFFKKEIWHCVPGNIAKFLRTPFFTEYLRWLLLPRGAVRSRCFEKFCMIASFS